MRYSQCSLCARNVPTDHLDVYCDGHIVGVGYRLMLHVVDPYCDNWKLCAGSGQVIFQNKQTEVSSYETRSY